MTITVNAVQTLTAALGQLFRRLIDAGYEAGIQTVIYHAGEKVLDLNVGTVDSASLSPVQSNTLFPVCSTSKGITATLIHMLAQQGKIDYEKKVGDYWPEFACNGKESVTVQQALAHMAGIPQRASYKTFADICDWQKACAKIAELTPKWTPGSTAEYHSFNWGWIAGRIAEGATRKRFADLLRENITEPLGLEKELYFGSDMEAEHRVSLFQAQPQQQKQCTTAQASHQSTYEVPGPLMDFVNRQDVRQACMPAVNGIMSAGAIAKVYAATLAPVGGVRLLNDTSLERAVRLQTPARVMPACFGHGMGLGYVLKGPLNNPGALFGHGGAGGSEGMANRMLNYAVGITKNRMDTHLNAPGHTNRLVMQEISKAFGGDGDGGFYAD